MARPAGVRNQDYDEKRQALVSAAADYVLREDVQTPSFRELATATGASEPTLRHYFKSRTGLVTDVIRHFDELSAPIRAYVRKDFDTFEEAMQDYQAYAARVSQDPALVRAHIFGLRESFLDADVFKAYIRHLVDPGTDALAERMLNSPGGPADHTLARVAASQIFSNVLFMACRKHLLGSTDPHPPDIGQNLQLMTNWLLYGMLDNPDGAGKRPD